MDDFSKSPRKASKDNSETDDLAWKQWLSIEIIEKQFNSKRIKLTNNKFEDQVWRNKWFANPITWTAACPARNLVFKCMASRTLHHNDRSFGTAVGVVSLIRNAFDDLFGLDVLQGGRGERLKGLNQIEQETFQANLDAMIMKEVHLHHFETIELLVKVCNLDLSSSPLFRIDFELPWKSTGLRKWLDDRRILLGVSLPTIYPYLAMGPETYEPLINKSIEILEGKADFITQFHQEFLDFEKNSIIKEKRFLGLHRYFRFRHDFNDFLKNNYQVLQGLPAYEPSMKPRSWWLKVVNHLRAACINIVLFTTGLRNGDICNLRLGCCRPSGRIDMLYYIEADIQKTKNRVHLPIPDQAKRAIEVLEKLRYSKDCPYVFSSAKNYLNDDFIERSPACNKTLNRLVSAFAHYYDIPFKYSKENEVEYTAHCYRATVAGWLEASGALSIIMIRRLFGHKNNLMPLAYIHHNPIFINHRHEALEQANFEMSQRIALAATEDVIGGKKGEELSRGITELRKSSSLSEFDIFKTVQEQLQERISNGSMMAMATYFGVICTRNPNDSSQPPCRKVIDKEKLKNSEFDRELWNHMQSSPDPAHCIGKLCDHAMIGPWSTPLRDSFNWFKGFLEKAHGQDLDSDAIAIQAKAFIKLYAPEMDKIFRINPHD